ncbi:TniQ family protein [Tritonibacter mobilis]|nr:TniQ family protein [Tritonibacter mobilis]
MMLEPVTSRLPVVPPPAADERLSSWLNRLATLYALSLDALLDHLGLARRNVFDLEWRLPAGEGALIARRTGLSPQALQAMTFHNRMPEARIMVASKNRYHCSLCPDDVHTRAAALPWAFCCPVHRTPYTSRTGEALSDVFGSGICADLNEQADRGAKRLDMWSRGQEEAAPAAGAIVKFLATRHRRSSPASVREQPRLSLQGRCDYHAFLNQPIARQALCVTVPEYDRAAPLLVKPVRPGFHALSQASLLQAYALAVGIGRLTENLIDPVVDVLMASDVPGEWRLREALKQWPLSSRRRIYARFWRAQRDERAR